LIHQAVAIAVSDAVTNAVINAYPRGVDGRVRLVTTCNPASAIPADHIAYDSPVRDLAVDLAADETVVRADMSLTVRRPAGATSRHAGHQAARGLAPDAR
jgi:hypothetical protein